MNTQTFEFVGVDKKNKRQVIKIDEISEKLARTKAKKQLTRIDQCRVVH